VLDGADFSYGLGVFDFSHEEVKRAVDLSYRFCFLHSSCYMRLFVPRSNERMITKKKKKKRPATTEEGNRIPSEMYLVNQPLRVTT